MEIEYADDSLARLETDPAFEAGKGGSVVKSFRKKINFIRQAVDERDIRAMKSLHFEKLKGREDEYSIRLNDQWRLIFAFKNEKGLKKVLVKAIEDYH
jgi:proteic killer suppression protein